MGWLSRLRSRNSAGTPSNKDMSAHDLRTGLLADRAVQSQSNLMTPSMSRSGSFASEEQHYVMRRIRDNPMWTLDRGTGFYQQERLNKKKASLLGSGRWVHPWLIHPQQLLGRDMHSIRLRLPT